jgi:hypothetical protein
MPKRPKDDPSPHYQRKEPKLGDGRYANGETIKDGKRICNRCQVWKSLDCYHKSKTGMAGIAAVCKECVNELARIRYNKNPEYYRDKRKDSKREYDQQRYAAMVAAGKKPAKDPKKEKNAYLMRNYGITIRDYDRILAEQGGKCAICGTSQSDRKDGKLVVDHCHASGKVRGILCHKCNLMLGNANDLISTLEQAVIYLRDRGEG